MQFRSSDTRSLIFIPLRDAVLCADCAFIAPAGREACSICGSRALISVPQVFRALMERRSAVTGAEDHAEKPGFFYMGDY